ncbi:MAG TPA: hypothetical protein VE010_11995, partial [Thermoanaerobaculia bacterium]|nr:hypothetical protein [Thermoanaerobaculia bacterium]
MKRTLIPLLLLSLTCLAAHAETPKKTVISKADELPRRSYKIEGTAAQLLEDRKQLDRLSSELIQNLEADLARYDIRDDATLKGYYSALHVLYMRNGDYDKAVALVAKMREAESKPALRHTPGLFTLAYVAALKKVSDPSSAEFKKAFEESYAAHYAKLPWAEVQDQIEQQKGQLAMMNREVMIGGFLSGFQQLLDNTKGTVPEGSVAGVLMTDYTLNTRLPLRDESVRVLTKLWDANHKSVAVTDIWKPRSVTLDGTMKLQPVVVAVWDSGVDPNALPAQNRFVNTKEKVDGKDNDGNGYIDDVHGIGYDLAKVAKSIGT